MTLEEQTTRWRIQFRLRTFLVCILFAGPFVAWFVVPAVQRIVEQSSRPARELRLELTARGTAIIHGKEMSLDSLSDALDREGRRRRVWSVEPVMTLRLDDTALYTDAVRTIESAQQAGFEKIRIGYGRAD